MGIFTTLVQKAAPASPVPGGGGWYPIVREPYMGAWQRNEPLTMESVLAHHAVFACVTLIASDIAKLRPKLMEQDADGIWTEARSPAFSPVLRRPNHYQNYIQFKECWITSKLLRGNTYVLKERDERGVVVRLYPLDPSRVRPMVAPDGSVFYELNADNLAGITEDRTGAEMVPAAEIIHDRMNCLFHPLVGVSALFASAVAAGVGLNIQRNSSAFFGTGSNPSGVLTAPGVISQPQAEEMSARWTALYSGQNAGKVAVLGNGLTFEPIRMSAVDSQLIDQLKWSAEVICSAFHVPAFKIGVGAQPTYQQNAEILNQVYYSDCLQAHIESFELCMDEGLGLQEPKSGKVYGVELDLDGLLRMDTATLVKTLAEGIGGALYTPNEARRKVDLKPLPGGQTVYMQQQNYSLAALDERDRNSPFEKPAPAPAPAPSSEEDREEGAAEAEAEARRSLVTLFRKAMTA